MKQLLYCYVFISLCSACNGQKSSPDSQTETTQNIVKNELIGAWNSDLTDTETKNSIGYVTMTFQEDGQLIYDIHIRNKLQTMNLVYELNEDTIISDQPSHPQEQKTKFRIENGDKLVLEFEGQKTVFLREKK